MLRTTAFIAFIAAFFICTAHSFAGQFSALIDFGDSLSDVGNARTASFGLIPGSPGYYNGRFSNGPIWLEKLGPSLGLPAATASLAGGNDYAYGGTTSGTGVTAIFPNIRTQVTSYIGAHSANSTQLFTMLGGANDLLNYLGGDPSTTPAQAADNISGSIQALYGDGARNILVANLPDLGLTPRFHGTSAQGSANTATTQFNTQLAMDLATDSGTDPGLTIYNLNLFSLVNQAVSTPFAYGLTDVSHQAYTGDNSYAGNGTAVSDASGYLFWDAIHPTTTGHALIANAALASIPEPTTMMLVLLTSAALLRPRRSPV